MVKRLTVIGAAIVMMMSVLTGCGEKKAGEYFEYEIMGEKENRYIRIMELTELGKEQEYIIIPGEIEGIKVTQLGGAYYYGAWESEKLKKVYVASYDEIVAGANFFESCTVLEKIILFFVPTVGGYQHAPAGKYSPNSQATIDSSRSGRANVSFRYNYAGAPNDGFYWIDDLDDELIGYIPLAPKREGYMFGGWYKEPACINAWNFAVDKIPAKIRDEDGAYIEYKETCLYAQWIEA